MVSLTFHDQQCCLPISANAILMVLSSIYLYFTFLEKIFFIVYGCLVSLGDILHRGKGTEIVIFLNFANSKKFDNDRKGFKNIWQYVR